MLVICRVCEELTSLCSSWQTVDRRACTSPDSFRCRGRILVAIITHVSPTTSSSSSMVQIHLLFSFTLVVIFLLAVLLVFCSQEKITNIPYSHIIVQEDVNVLILFVGIRLVFINVV